MIKRTLYFGNPAYLSLKLGQIVVYKPASGEEKKEVVKTIPVEDIASVVLDNKQITITQALLESLLKENCAVITCDSSHLPTGLMLPLDGHTLQNERFRSQIDASLPLKKQIWQQTIQSKLSIKQRSLNMPQAKSIRICLNGRLVYAAGILIILKHEQRHTTGRIFSLTISEVSFEGGTKMPRITS